jgi:hypothetical protein
MSNSHDVADEHDANFSLQKLLPHIEARRDDAARMTVFEGPDH